MNVTIVPFLLGMILTSDRSLDKIFEYTFHVDVTLWNARDQDTTITQLTLDLMCHDVLNGLMCRLGSYNKIIPIPRKLNSLPDYAYSIIDPRAFYNNSEPFMIKFSTKGIDNYVVEYNTTSAKMMNVYRMIANQLNVGADIRRYGNNFKKMERSNMGLCQTEYNIVKMPSRQFDLNITLTSLIGLNLEDTIIISKRKEYSTCRLRSNYFFAARFWHDINSLRGTSYSFEESISNLTMSLHGMQSLTENVFRGFNEAENTYRYMVESIDLRLKSYRELSPNHTIKFEGKKTVLLDVINDDKA